MVSDRRIESVYLTPSETRHTRRCFLWDEDIGGVAVKIWMATQHRTAAAAEDAAYKNAACYANYVFLSEIFRKKHEWWVVDWRLEQLDAEREIARDAKRG